MKASIIAICIAVALVIPAHAIECQLSKGARGYHWAWREIDGRRCWYEGGRGMAKSELHWPAPFLKIIEMCVVWSGYDRAGVGGYS
jgi:hypothetical protein